MIAGTCALALAAIGGCEPTSHVVFTAREPLGGGAGAAGAAGAGSGSGGAGGSAGGVIQRPAEEPPLNPDVRFEWRETVPGQGGCRPGVYVGRFACRQGGALLFPVEGNMRFRLAGSEEDQVLNVVDGELAGFSSMLTGKLLNADLMGTLDCISGDFEGRTENGEVFAAPFSNVFPFLSGGAFEGTLDGTIDTRTATVSGRWTMSGSLACNGDFSAALSL